MTASKYSVPASAMRTHLVEDRRAEVSPWGRGNSKLGPGIYTYSKLAGRQHSCPGSTDSCEEYCYAKRLVTNPWVWKLLADNTARGDALPPLPDDAKIVRFHVSGDFDTAGYVESWIELAKQRPAVKFFGYTRSWRCDDILPALERFRALPNVFLWASVDAEMTVLPPTGWKIAWVEDDPRVQKVGSQYIADDNKASIACPEEAGKVKDCETCRFCFQRKHPIDLVFLKH